MSYTYVVEGELRVLVSPGGSYTLVDCLPLGHVGEGGNHTPGGRHVRLQFVLQQTYISQYVTTSYYE